MADVPLWTYQDLLDHLTDWMGANVSAEANRDARRAVQEALRVFGYAHPWQFYYQRGRITTNAQYNTGTVAYTNSSRTVTLSGGTWPSYAAGCTILINSVEYSVVSRTDDSNIILSVNSNPGADVAAGTTFTLYQDTYALPADLKSLDEIINVTYVLGLEYVHPNSWLTRHRLVYTPATPYRYTITGHPSYYGTMAVRFFPAPDSQYNMDYIYQRRPRPLVIDSQYAGTVTITSGTTTVTGAGTNFTSSMIGSVLRVSADAVNYPTGVAGSNPYNYERVITGVSSTTVATLDAAAPSTVTAVKYNVSDPLDIEDGAMLTAFLRCCEWQLARARRMKDSTDAEGAYQRALVLAREADSRSTQVRIAGESAAPRMRLAYMPSGPDIG